MTDLSDLIKRVEQATGPDRQLDYDINYGVLGRDARSRAFTAHYTSSLDAALDLVEEKLPGCRWTKNIEGEIWLWHGDWSTSSHRCANDALTCLFALLHALHSQSDSERSPPLKDGG